MWFRGPNPEYFQGICLYSTGGLPSIVLAGTLCYHIKSLLIISNFLETEKTIVSNWYQKLDDKLIRECLRFTINTSWILVAPKRVYWESMLSQNFKLLIPFPLICLCSFYIHPPPSQLMFALVSYPTPLSKKVPWPLWISECKFGGWKEIK